MIEVKPKPDEKLDLPFKKVEQEGVDEDDLEEPTTPSTKPNHHTYDPEHEGIEVLETLHFDDEVLENDLVANSGQTLTDDHDDVVNQVLRGENGIGSKVVNPFEGLMDPIKLFRYEDCKVPDVIVRQSDTQIFLMFEAKGIETPIIDQFVNQ